MGRFDRSIATAKKAIARNGVKVVWRRYTAGAPADPDKPWEASDSTFTDTDVNIVFLNVDRTDERLMQFVSGTELAGGFLRGLMADVGFKPSLNDKVINGDETYGIKNIDTLAPNNQVILHKIEFDKAK